MSIRRELWSIAAVLVAAFFIISLSKDLISLLSARERIAREEQQVRKLEEEQQQLASRLEYVMSDAFVEKEAREKLLMGRPGESVVLLPEEKTSSDGQISSGGDAKKPERELANWEKWMRLFF